MPAVRPAAVAGMFYPGTPSRLAADVRAYLADVPPSAGAAPKAIVVPHAGYVYSGPVAAYAYDWTLPKPGEAAEPRARAMSFQESLVTAFESEAAVELDPESLNPHFAYGDENGRTHQVWLTDGVTANNESNSFSWIPGCSALR